MADKIQKGRPTRVYIKPVSNPDIIPLLEPNVTTNRIVLGATAAPKSAGPATLTVAAIPAGMAFPSGTFLTFKDPASGKEVLVQATADSPDGDTSIEVAEVPSEIPASSYVQLPMFLPLRSNANQERTGQTQTADVFEEAVQITIGTGFQGNVTMNGYYAPLSAAFKNLENALFNQLDILTYIVYPNPNRAIYSRGEIHYGLMSVTGAPLNSEAAGLIASDLTASFLQTPKIAFPKPL